MSRIDLGLQWGNISYEKLFGLLGDNIELAGILKQLEYHKFEPKFFHMISLLLVEDNEKLRKALKTGLEATGEVQIMHVCGRGEDAIAYCLSSQPPDVILMDVQLEGELNGIKTAVEIRREYPRHPIVFYSIQDDDAYYRDFRRSGILSHYAYVRKTNYLLPEMIIPLLKDALAGRSFIDPEIEARVQEVRYKDEQDPLALLEPNEQVVARLLAQGLTNEQIAAQLGFRDKRTISRTNGQIYTTWGLNLSSTDEKIARSRAIIIVQSGQLLNWDENGIPQVQDTNGEWIPWNANQ